METATNPEKAKPGSSLFPMEGLLGISLSDQALDALPRLWPLTRFPRLGDPSEPSLAP
jgi:hypothetical protein